jgi:hypothetical protein
LRITKGFCFWLSPSTAAVARNAPFSMLPSYSLSCPQENDLYNINIEADLAKQLEQLRTDLAGMPGDIQAHAASSPHLLQFLREVADLCQMHYLGPVVPVRLLQLLASLRFSAGGNAAAMAAALASHVGDVFHRSVAVEPDSVDADVVCRALEACASAEPVLKLRHSSFGTVFAKITSAMLEGRLAPLSIDQQVRLLRAFALLEVQRGGQTVNNVVALCSTVQANASHLSTVQLELVAAAMAAFPATKYRETVPTLQSVAKETAARLAADASPQAPPQLDLPEKPRTDIPLGVLLRSGTDRPVSLAGILAVCHASMAVAAPWKAQAIRKDIANWAMEAWCAGAAPAVDAQNVASLAAALARAASSLGALRPSPALAFFVQTATKRVRTGDAGPDTAADVLQVLSCLELDEADTPAGEWTDLAAATYDALLHSASVSPAAVNLRLLARIHQARHCAPTCLGLAATT